MIRIALCGASGTGKTTLAGMLSQRLDLEINPVGSRSVAAAMGFDSPYDVDAAGRRAEFQRRLLEEKVAWERGRDAFVTDRTTWDNLVYTALHDVRAVDDEMFERTRRGFGRYTHVVLCPIGVFQRLGDDQARLHERAYHRIFEVVLNALIDEQMLHEMTDHRPRFSMCAARTMDERYQWADWFCNVLRRTRMQ